MREANEVRFGEEICVCFAVECKINKLKRCGDAKQKAMKD